MWFLLLLLLPCSAYGNVKRAPATCRGYEEHPLIVVSLDGFLSSYIDRGFNPTLKKLADEGVSTDYMIPSMPTVTFPNHYTIATGLYPESHGIIANSFHDSSFNESFTAAKLPDGKWFSGEPIWNTVVKNGKKSATYFWIGSEAEINGIRPTFTEKYDKKVPYKDRINQVLKWLEMPKEERPLWMCVYFNEPDSTGHKYGPDSSQVNETLVRMDKTVASLVDGIAKLGLTDCVNLIIVSDHGMAAGGKSRKIDLENYDSQLDKKAHIFEGPNSRFELFPNKKDEKVDIMEELSCQKPYMRQFDKVSLPKRYHYSNNRRIEDIILDLDDGYSATFEKKWFIEGNHGYDNEFEAMQAIFIASGPDFKNGIKTAPFQNIELYNLMCDLLSMSSAPNNGTKGSLYHIMANPPPYPELPSGQSPINGVFPNNSELMENLNSSGCSGDHKIVEPWMNELKFDNLTKEFLLSLHTPFGAPYSKEDFLSPIRILYHSDHITGYSESLKLPLWTSFTITSQPQGSETSSWSSDFRLSQELAPSCVPAKYSLSLLFPKNFSTVKSMAQAPFLMSNAVPLSNQLKSRYDEMVEDLIPHWIQSGNGPLNVIVGPVFDNNMDSLVDDIKEIENYKKIPSDLFVITTRCSKSVAMLSQCEINDIEVMAFIYGQNQTVTNCLDKIRFAEEFNARVKDVELSTSLVFFSSLGYKQATDIALRIHFGIWDFPPPDHSLGNSILSNYRLILIVISIKLIL